MNSLEYLCLTLGIIAIAFYTLFLYCAWKRYSKIVEENRVATGDMIDFAPKIPDVQTGEDETERELLDTKE